MKRRFSTRKMSGRTVSTTTGGQQSSNISPERFFDLTRERAFELYCRRGSGSGDATGDWLEAEKQVRKKLKLR